MAIQFREIIQVLSKGEVEFILIGGFAANLHGAPSLLAIWISQQALHGDRP
jgi:hypothetical protein